LLGAPFALYAIAAQLASKVLAVKLHEKGMQVRAWIYKFESIITDTTIHHSRSGWKFLILHVN
jgi:hypothetical protein